MKKLIQFAILSKYIDGKRRKRFVFHAGKSGLIYIGLYRFRVAFNWKDDARRAKFSLFKFVAKTLKFVGVKPTWTTNIEGQLTCGYGKCDNNGFWQFELHTEKSK